LLQQNISFSEEDENEIDIRSPKLLPIITYPHFSESEYKDRISEMESLGIKSIILGGKTIVNNTHVAGKGCVGIVLKARADNNTVCAVKIRRTDADRKTMDEEARIHRIANSVGVGPRLQGQTKNIVAMEFIDGHNIVDWLSDPIPITITTTAAAKTTTTAKATRTKSSSEVTAITTTTKKINDVCRVTRAILEQCFILDTAGIDHGELSRLRRHIIIVSEDNNCSRPCIIDFESASTSRKTSNVTAATQSVFLYGPVSKGVKRILGGSNNAQLIIDALKIYKHSHTRTNFDRVVNSLSI
jgi:putative serine/threonine protein kinase